MLVNVKGIIVYRFSVHQTVRLGLESIHGRGEDGKASLHNSQLIQADSTECRGLLKI